VSLTIQMGQNLLDYLLVQSVCTSLVLVRLEDQAVYAQGLDQGAGVCHDLRPPDAPEAVALPREPAADFDERAQGLIHRGVVANQNGSV
jgi:hypothetical protein